MNSVHNSDFYISGVINRHFGKILMGYIVMLFLAAALTIYFCVYHVPSITERERSAFEYMRLMLYYSPNKYTSFNAPEHSATGRYNIVATLSDNFKDSFALTNESKFLASTTLQEILLKDTATYNRIYITVKAGNDSVMNEYNTASMIQ